MSTEFVVEVPGGSLSGRRGDPTPDCRAPAGPLIVALHGGSYSAVYFDVPGFSLLDRAAEAGCTAIALDRPGYRSSTLPEYGESLFEANIAALDAGIAELWRTEPSDAAGVVLLGHSIGGALALLLAAGGTSWPLLGVAVSGVALDVPPTGPAYEEEGPAPVRVDIPDEVRTAAMFGPPGSYDPDAPQRASVANQPVVYAEVAEMNARWSELGPEAYRRIAVPVQVRLGEHDVVWEQGAAELERVRRSLVAAPRVDVARVPAAGHSIDFHRTGAAHQDAQIAFALACASA